MTVTNAFKEAVETGNIRRLRIMMKDGMLADPTFKEYREMEQVASTVSGLYDVHDGRPFITDKTQWTDDYMDKVMVQVVGNFSHERIGHLMEVIRYLRPRNKTDEACKSNASRADAKKVATFRTYKEQKKYDQEAGNYIATGAGVGACVGGVTGGVVASVISSSAVTGVAIGVVGGVIVGGIVGAIVEGGGETK